MFIYAIQHTHANGDRSMLTFPATLKNGFEELPLSLASSSRENIERLMTDHFKHSAQKQGLKLTIAKFKRVEE